MPETKDPVPLFTLVGKNVNTKTNYTETTDGVDTEVFKPLGRGEAKAAIQAGRVKVDGEVCDDPDAKVPADIPVELSD